ncbi:hypothetical protein WA158_003494 [Blastocystis sp. Blastoise]
MCTSSIQSIPNVASSILSNPVDVDLSIMNNDIADTEICSKDSKRSKHYLNQKIRSMKNRNNSNETALVKSKEEDECCLTKCEKCRKESAMFNINCKKNSHFSNNIEKQFFESKLFSVNCDSNDDSEVINRFIFKDNTTLFANKTKELSSNKEKHSVLLSNNNKNDKEEDEEDLSSPPYSDREVSPPTSPIWIKRKQSNSLKRRDIFGNFLNTHKSKKRNNQILDESQNDLNQDNSLFNTNNSLNNVYQISEQHQIQQNYIETISSSSLIPSVTSTQNNYTNLSINNAIDTLISETNFIESNLNNYTNLNNENIAQTLINETDFIETDINNNNNENMSQSIVDDSFNSTFVFENNDTNDNTQPTILNNPITPLHNQHNNDILSDNNSNNNHTPSIHNTPNSNTNNQIVSPSTSLIITPPRLSPIINSSVLRTAEGVGERKAGGGVQFAPDYKQGTWKPYGNFEVDELSDSDSEVDTIKTESEDEYEDYIKNYINF